MAPYAMLDPISDICSRQDRQEKLAIQGSSQLRLTDRYAERGKYVYCADI